MSSIIHTFIPYSFSVLEKDLLSLTKTYSFLKKEVIGYSVLGNPIYAIRLGIGSKEVGYFASFHANEWITSPLLMKFIEDFCIAYMNHTNIYGYSAKEVFDTTSIYLVPMVNPDGVNLVTKQFPTNSAPYLQALSIADAFPLIPFPNGWKANISGVDLNLQFPADWAMAKTIKFSQGYRIPAPRDFVGFGPLTEPESLAVYQYTLSHDFRLVLAYHTQGEVIYWKYSDFLPPRSEYIGRHLSEASTYLLDITPPNSSYAGYKDWFIQDYNRPGYTIEAGLGENPLPPSQFPKIYQDNLGVLFLSAILA